MFWGQKCSSKFHDTQRNKQNYVPLACFEQVVNYMSPDVSFKLSEIILVSFKI